MNEDFKKWLTINSRQSGKTQTFQRAMEFQQKYMGEWVQPDPKLTEIAEYYIYKTEKYDRLICTGGYKHDGILPANLEERKLINQNARKVEDECRNFLRKNKLSWKDFVKTRQSLERHLNYIMEKWEDYELGK